MQKDNLDNTTTTNMKACTESDIRECEVELGKLLVRARTRESLLTYCCRDYYGGTLKTIP
jgi:hypothetical protein